MIRIMGEGNLVCKNTPRIFCLHVTTHEADAGRGDSGSGVSQRVGSLFYLFGSTVAGNDSDHVNIVTRSQQQLPDFCYYTGVCVTKEMANTETDALERSVYTQFDTVYAAPKNRGQY